MFKQLTSHCGIRLGLAWSLGMPLSALAQWPELVDTLPGVDAVDVNWNAQGLWVLGGADLRRLALDTGPGGLLLRERIESLIVANKVLLGDRLAALRADDGQVWLYDLETGSHGDYSGVSAAAQDSVWLLMATQDHFYRCRLDSSFIFWEAFAEAFPEPPEALSLQGEQVWALAADTLRGVSLAIPPLVYGSLPFADHPLALCQSGERLVACLGEGGLRVVDISEPETPFAAPAWQPGFPVLDAIWWREQLWALAAGDSGLALADFSDPGAPDLLGRWRTVQRAQRLGLKGDSLLVAEGAAGVSLHVLRDEGGNARPELLARHATRPHILKIQNGHWSYGRAWMLDREQGFRVFAWPEQWPYEGPQEEGGVALPLPVDGGDWRDGLIAGCRYGAGLRFYEETEDGIVLRGINPGDPVKLLAWGPDNLIAYVTPDAFVALKQANLSPWFLLHHGTIYLQAEPLCAAWTSDQRLFVGCADGRLFQVDATDPQAPVLEQVLTLAGPVRDVSVQHPYDGWSGDRLAVTAGKLYLLQRQAGTWVAADSLAADQGAFTCVAINELWGLAGADNPPRIFELALGLDDISIEAAGLAVTAPPLAVGRRISDAGGGFCWAALDNGDLLYLCGNDEIGVDPGPARPGLMTLSAHPNPFNPVTRLSFTLEAPVDGARLTVHDLAGRLVSRRELGPLPAGEREITLAAEGWPSGLYLARLEAGDRTALAKLLLIR